MRYQEFVWVGSFASIFFFLPSLAMKIANFFRMASWQQKSMLIYLGLAIVLYYVVRRRLAKRQLHKNLGSEEAPIVIAKRRLAMGEITVHEFREIKQELQ